MGNFNLIPTLNTDFVSAEHQNLSKVIPPMSPASRNEKIQQLERSLIEFRVKRDECQRMSSSHWQEAAILEKRG